MKRNVVEVRMNTDQWYEGVDCAFELFWKLVYVALVIITILNIMGVTI